ncbi:hypothetical protein DL771_002409 [Monosporascus sp. 5C6A]|nr:hypothetical protein DL771_002409 [Monosporascus sp. 5C6A]
MVAQSADPDGYSSGQTPRFLLKKGTPREYDTLEFHVSTKAGMLWTYINPNVAQVPPLLPMPVLPEPQQFQPGATDEATLDASNYTKYERALKSYDRKQTLYIAQEKALAEVSIFLNQSVHPDHHWVYWKKATFRERLVALKNEFKPSNNARIYEVDARYKQALKTNRAVNAYSPDFSVTQIATVEDAMFGGKDPAELLPVQKLVERFRSHMRLRKAQGATAEQLSRGAFGVTLNGETLNQTGAFSDNRNNNRNNNSSQNNNGSRNNGSGDGNNRLTPKCFCGEFYRFKGCPYINKNVNGKLLAGGKYLDIVGEGTRRITLTTLTGRLFQQAGIYWNHETDVVYYKATGTKMAKVNWIERQPVIHHIEVTAENNDDDTVPTAFAVAEEPTATVPEDESDLEEEVILESEDEEFVPEPSVQEFLLPKLILQQKLYGNSFRLPLKLLEGDVTLWHRRLVHLGPRALEKVVQVVTGAKIQLPSKIDC